MHLLGAAARGGIILPGHIQGIRTTAANPPHRPPALILPATSYWNAEAWGWGDFDAWDLDTDQGLTREEFRQGFGQNAFSAWDEDGDGVIREGEARQVFFAWWDTNQDGVITEEEWNRG